MQTSLIKEKGDFCMQVTLRAVPFTLEGK